MDLEPLGGCVGPGCATSSARHFREMGMKANLLFGLGACLFTGASAFGQLVVTVDENGKGNVNGQVLPAMISADPTVPSGSGTLAYFSPAANVVLGDVLILEPASPAAPQSSDLIRFLQTPGVAGTQLYFYSDRDPTDPTPALADVGLPANVGSTAIGPFVTFTETGLENATNGFLYSPTPNQPGYFPIDTAGHGPTYNIISDTPEPASAATLLAGAGFLALGRRRASRRA